MVCFFIAVVTGIIFFVAGRIMGFMSASKLFHGVYHLWPKRDTRQLYDEHGVPVFPADRV